MWMMGKGAMFHRIGQQTTRTDRHQTKGLERVLESRVHLLSPDTEGPVRTKEMKWGVLQRATGTGWLGDGHSVSGDIGPALQGSELRRPPYCSLSPANDHLFIDLTNIY